MNQAAIPALIKTSLLHGQPFLNLANQEYPLLEIFSDEHVKGYKAAKLKALYFRIGKLTLSDDLAKKIDGLVQIGIREVLICYDAISDITQEDFNQFLRDYKVSINLQMLPISEGDITRIRKDKVGKDNLLGFETLSNHRLTYRDHFSLAQLNNETSDQIIRQNYQAKRARSSISITFEEPKYISSSTDEVVKPRRTKTLTELRASLEVSVNAQTSTQVATNVDKSADKDEELSAIDEAQLNDAIYCDSRTGLTPDQYAANKAIKFFYESYVHSCAGIHTIFCTPSCNQGIKGFSGKALDFMMQHKICNIRLSNLLSGLAFDKDKGVVFLSEQRLKSMPINDLTMRTNYAIPRVTDPILYSWLPYEAYSTVSLNDLYGTSVAPQWRKEKNHPFFMRTTFLDWRTNAYIEWLGNPFTKCASHYKIMRSEHNAPELVFDGFHQPLGVSMKKTLNDIFPGIFFEGFLSENDIETLTKIWLELQERKITDVFVASIRASDYNDGSFLLEPEGQAFLHKLFTEIMPPSKTLNKKRVFFQEILSELSPVPSNLAVPLEDIFEGLNGAYEQFKEFLRRENVFETDAKFDEFFKKFKKTLIVRLSKYSGNIDAAGYWKRAIIDAMAVFRLNSKNGGSLEEQFENLQLEFHAFDTSDLDKAEQHNANTVHPHLLTNIYDGNIYCPLGKFNKAIITLSAVSINKRASFDSYYKLYQLIDDFRPFSLERDCYDVVGIATADYLLDTMPQLPWRMWAPAADYKNLEKILEQALRKAVPRIRHCTPSIGVATQYGNLIRGFTVNQAEQNLAFLVWSMKKSSGHYYTAQYPIQEFDSYVALLSIVLDEFRMKEARLAGTKKYHVKVHYNNDEAKIKDRIDENQASPQVIDIEQEHLKAVTGFIELQNENPEFAFGEGMMLGLINHFTPQNRDQAVAYAKTLKAAYGEFLYRGLRVVLSNPSLSENTTSHKQGLVARIDNVFKYLECLNQNPGIDGYETVHAFLTENAAKPENLVLFANAWDSNQPQEAFTAKLIEFHERLRSMTTDEKAESLDALYSVKLPFSEGGINDIRESLSKNEREHQTRFNTLGEARLMDQKLHLDMLERRHYAQFSEKFKSSSYAQLKDRIMRDSQYVVDNLRSTTERSSADIAADPEFARDLATAMLEIFSQHGDFLHLRSIQLLFDQGQTLKEQITDLEFSKIILERHLFNRCNEIERSELLTALKAGEIPTQSIRDVLVYLKAISHDLLKIGMTLVSLVQLVPKELYKNLEVLKVVTNFALKNKSIELKALYVLAAPLAYIKGVEAFLDKILQHCKKLGNYKPLEILKSVDFKAKDLTKLLEWILDLEMEEIDSLVQNPHLNLKQLLSMKHLDKMTVVKDIAHRLGDALSEAQYKELISIILRNDLNIGKLLKSYLLAPVQAASVTEIIELIFDNLKSLDRVQELFSERNLQRFDYNASTVRKKISEIKYIGKETIPADQQAELFSDFEQVMHFSKEYCSLNYNEVRNEAIKLKERRLLARQDLPEISHELDLKFLAVTAEVMYRETGLYPRYHQILTTLVAISGVGHLIQQVATGEGKSIIGLLEAVQLWFSGQTVDMLTANRKLSTRDLHDFSAVLDALGIEHSKHIITPDSPIAHYKIGGINYAAADDMALARATWMFFESGDKVLALNACVSGVWDEGDGTLLSPVNFKLAQPLLLLTSEEIEALFRSILDFIKTSVFKNLRVSSKDDIANLKMFLEYQFGKKYAKFPLSAELDKKFQGSSDAEERTLHLLNQALSKLTKDSYKIFDLLLDSALTSQKLEDGKDFVVKQFTNDEDEIFYKIVPIINHQPSPGTVFGGGVHAFLAILLAQHEKYSTHPFWIVSPTATIFNVSPKNLSDYYSQSGGRILILTATPGELDEFHKVNHISKAVSIPRFNGNAMEVLETKAVKLKEAINIIDKFAGGNEDRPNLIFADSAKKAKEIFDMLPSKNGRTKVLCTGSEDDGKECQDIANIAGINGMITVTTPMLGRGVDFKTAHTKGFMLYNLATEITLSDAFQIIGRAARNGHSGTVQQLCDADIVGNATCQDYMEIIAKKHQGERLSSQPLTDVLYYFPRKNKGNAVAAIYDNDLISEIWAKILAEFLDSNKQVAIEDTKGLRDKLVERITPEFSTEIIAGLNDYLAGLDTIRVFESKTLKDQKFSDCQTGLIVPYDSTTLARNAMLDLKRYYIKVFTHVFSLPDTKFLLDGISFDGEGAYGNLMLHTFIASFVRYQQHSNSKEVDWLRGLIDKFVNINDLNIDRMELDAFQPIAIATKVTSEAGHAESILTNGQILLWVNSEEGGIKVFLIKHGIDKVRDVFCELQNNPQSQADTCKLIYTLLREDGSDDKIEPKHVVISVEKQTIGNCGWVQTAGMLVALSIVNHFDFDGKLPVVESPEWQKVVKDSRDIYESWKRFNDASKLEAAVCLVDKDECRPEFLSKAEQAEIEEQRASVEGKDVIITQQLLERVAKAAKVLDTQQYYTGLSSENSIHASAKSLQLLSALGSEMGQTLQKAIGSLAEAKALLKQCSDNVDFGYLDMLHTEISLGRFSEHTAPLFAQAVQLACVHNASEEQVGNYLALISEHCAAAADNAGFESCLGIQAKVFEVIA